MVPESYSILFFDIRLIESVTKKFYFSDASYFWSVKGECLLSAANMIIALTLCIQETPNEHNAAFHQGLHCL